MNGASPVLGLTGLQVFRSLTTRRLTYLAQQQRSPTAASRDDDATQNLSDDEEADERSASLDNEAGSPWFRSSERRGAHVRLRRPVALETATALLLARALDSRSDLLAALRTEAPVVIIQVVDPVVLPIARSWLGRLVWPTGGPVLIVNERSRGDDPTAYVGAVLFTDAPRRSGKDSLTPAIIEVLQLGLPIMVLAGPGGFVPEPLVRAALGSITLPALDASLLALTIRIVTGRRSRSEDLVGVDVPPDLVDLAIAVRHNRTPAACIAELKRLSEARERKRGARDLRLDELHGLNPAVAWARSVIADLAAWRRGEIHWDAIDHGVVLDGPPGTGKTLFARVFASEAGLPLVTGSLAKWQAAGHLGDLLKAMRADFALARAQAPAVLFVDEVDAFPDRSTVTHDHRDYQVEVVNGFIEQLDGAEGREGLIFIAASNDIGRCDPAIVRSGRLNRIVRIGLPDASARASMLRVRLGADLPGLDLMRVARLIERMSGADIEKLVKDARRVARQAGRPLADVDLLAAATADTDRRSPDILRRVAIHEGGHAVLTVLLRGPEDVSAALQVRDGMGGWIERKLGETAGTRAELEDEIAILLAGRAAEQLAFGDAGAGSGGVQGSDLAQATRIAVGMVCSLGHAGPHPLLFLGPLDGATEWLSIAPIREAALAVLKTAEARVAALVRTHRIAIERVAARLVESRFVDGHAVAEIITATQA